MDTLAKNEHYRQVLQGIIHRYAKMPRREGMSDLTAICDDAGGRYLLMRVGWDIVGRAHNILIHLRLLDGKVYIEYDGIEHGIAYDLLEAGIPKEDIFLADEPQPRAVADLLAA